ncbi:hypothetical protein B0H11DRAFT_2192819 [Mycena galericulata]|nr:hypothetical protein B0H11DRAFT_2192819 [Mycena galericulata]
MFSIRDKDQDTYIVFDKHLEQERLLLKSCLRDHLFDITAWYQNAFGVRVIYSDNGQVLTSVDGFAGYNFVAHDSDFSDVSSVSSVSYVSSVKDTDDTDPEMPGLTPISDSESDGEPTNNVLYPGDANETVESRLALIERLFGSSDPLVLASMGDPAPPRSHQIGDLLGIGAHAMLEFLQPYPGDELVPLQDERRARTRFNLLRVSENDYTIWDEYFHEITVLPVRLLKNPSFEIAAWYARQRRDQLDYPEENSRPIHRVPVDDLVLAGANQYFQEINGHLPEFAGYEVRQRSLAGYPKSYSEKYVLTRPGGYGDLRCHSLPEDLLLNQFFDLVGWARKIELKAQLEENEYENGLEHNRGGD